jgi:hypothetical protein
MRNRALHDALRDFALEAADLLTADLEGGAELEFDLEDEGSRRGPALYRYSPLTERFIEERWHRLRELPTCASACSELGAGAARYLMTQGVAGDDCEPALRAMLERLYEDASSFRFPEERFERVYEEVDLTLYESSLSAVVVAAMPGLELESDRVELGYGLALARPGAVDAPPEAVWDADEGTRRALVVLERRLESGEPLPVDEARWRFRCLVVALRLFKAGGVSVSGLGFGRAAEGRWQALEVESAGAVRGEPWLLREDEEETLRELTIAVESPPAKPRIQWALARFDMGCTRALELEALSDQLLALRGLLDASDEAGRASLPLRLAALCAEEGERHALRRRVELTLALERFVMGGTPGAAVLDAETKEAPAELATELEGHVRALLRDVLCGHLDTDLKRVADDILLESSEPIEIDAQDLREPEEEPEEEPEPPPRRVSRPAEWRPFERIEPRETNDAPEGVTPSADWTDFSAPV